VSKAKGSKDVTAVLNNRFYRGNNQRDFQLTQARLNARIAHQIRCLRVKNGLTQKHLAELVSTSPSVISRLENAEYGGHSIPMLSRIAKALGTILVVRFRTDASASVPR